MELIILYTNNVLHLLKEIISQFQEIQYVGIWHNNGV